MKLSIKLCLCLAFVLSGGLVALPEEYAVVLEKLNQHSPQPRYSVRHLEFMHDVYEFGRLPSGPQRLVGPEIALPEEDERQLTRRSMGGSLIVPDGIEMPAVPELPDSVDADFRENTRAQFALAKEMAEHAFIEVHREDLLSGVDPSAADESFANLYRSWSDEANRDDVFRPGNIEYLLDFWVSLYQARCLAFLNARLAASGELVESDPLRGLWMNRFLKESDEKIAVSPILEEQRKRALLAARETAQDLFAERHIDRYLRGTRSEHTREVLQLAIRLRNTSCQPKLMAWLVNHAESADALREALRTELWDTAFVRFSVAGLDETAEALVERMQKGECDAYESPQRAIEFPSPFIVALNSILREGLARFDESPADFFVAFVESALSEFGLRNFRVAALIMELGEYVESELGQPVMGDLEAGLSGLVHSLTQGALRELSWAPTASSEATLLLFHIIVHRRGWHLGTEASGVDMLQVIDRLDSPPYERAAARYALSQFGPQVFGDLLARRFEDPTVGAEAFATCVQALFRALETSSPPTP